MMMSFSCTQSQKHDMVERTAHLHHVYEGFATGTMSNQHDVLGAGQPEYANWSGYRR